jgi:hypothetical protein
MAPDVLPPLGNGSCRGMTLAMPMMQQLSKLELPEKTAPNTALAINAGVGGQMG